MNTHRPLTWRQLMEAVEEMDRHIRQLLQIRRVPRAASVEAVAIHQIAEDALQRDGRRVAPLFPREPKPPR